MDFFNGLLRALSPTGSMLTIRTIWPVLLSCPEPGIQA